MKRKRPDIPRLEYTPASQIDYYTKLLEMSYQSPIEATIGRMRLEQEKRLEGEVFKAIQEVCVTVDKDELVKALQYDRNQYEKGFVDGCRNDVDALCRQVRADTVRKMQAEIESRCIKGGIYPAFVKSTIDKIAKEMLEVSDEPH